MNANPVAVPTRETLLHRLYEAAELEHTLMCTYLYAAFSLRDPSEPDFSPVEADAIRRWRSVILQVAIEEMGHLTAVWNITAALGGTPRFGRGNFPLDPGALPAGVVVKLTPFSEATMQHFIFLERPMTSTERDGTGFSPELMFQRGVRQHRLTPMACDYDTVGEFYACLGVELSDFVAEVGEEHAFSGEASLQLSAAETTLRGARPVICSKTALAAFSAIVEEGEGASADNENSHYRRFVALREELLQLCAANPAFTPAHPAAVNPVLRRPLRPEGRVWIEDELAAEVVDLANTGYALMLRLLAYAYNVPRPQAEKALAVDLALGTMRAVTPLAEAAARMPAGPSNPSCHAGVSFTALRDAAPFQQSAGARRFFVERFEQLASTSARLPAQPGDRLDTAARVLRSLLERAQRGFAEADEAKPLPAAVSVSTQPAADSSKPSPESKTVDGVESVEGEHLTLQFESKRCIHARFCVTGAPKVFLANVQGPWIHPDAMPVTRLVEIAHACPSGAIRYRRKDSEPNETPPPVNLLAVREAGPYAVRGELRVAGRSELRATLCRCGASKNKPYCDSSHHDVHFEASGEPPTGTVDMLPTRDGVLHIEPEVNGPLAVRGNLEITSGTGRAVARITSARLCRCGGSATKPFCDGTHARIGFKSV